MLTIKISPKIKEDSKEYKSLKDKNKKTNFYNVAKYGLNSTDENRGGQLEILKQEFEDYKNKILHIPINSPKIYHHNNPEENLKLCSYGGLFLNNEVIKQSLNSASGYAHQISIFDELESIHLKDFLQYKKLLKKIYFKHISAKARSNRKILQDESKPKILFFCEWFSNAYHFTFEDYPRLVLLLEHLREKNITDYYIVAPPRYRGFNKYHKWFMDEIFQSLSIDKDKIIYLDYQNYAIKNVYYCSNPQCNDIPIVSAIEKLKKYFYARDFQGAGERIYISRKKSPRRFLTNEDEIFEVLKKFGFKKIYMEDYSLSEKINLIIRAKIVLSIEGTSLVNGFFMDGENCKLIALRDHSMTDHTLVIASVFKNIEFLPIICDIAEQIGNTEYPWVESNLYLDPKYLKEKLKEYGLNEI